jgi:Domain of unknown function (DUF4252)
MSRAWMAMLMLPAMLSAQDISLSLFSSLAPKATEKVEVTLDGALLQMASVFLDDKDQEESKVKGILGGLKGIYVRSFKFAKVGEFSDADIQAVRAQLKGWNQIVNVQQAEQNTGVYLKTDGKKIQGMVVLAAEPKELTVVNIVGSIDLEQLRNLSGHLGIPDLGGAGKKSAEKNKGK